MAILIDLLDDDTRPKAPRIESVTEAQRWHGKRLAQIHEIHLHQMAYVRHVMEQIEAGQTGAEALGEAIGEMHMRNNYRAFGNLCGQECQMLTFHHTAEDEYIFPALMQGSEGLRKVVERLGAEHGVIHQLLEAFETCAAALIEDPGPDNFASVKETFDTLEKVVKSHFGYEQTELEEALGYMNVPL
jgi:hypothetical protein